MRAVIIAIIITIAIVLGWYFSYSSVKEDTSHFISSLSELSQNIEARQWEEAENEFSDIEEKWNKIKSTWSVILDIKEIDEIELIMGRTKEYLKSQEHVLSLGEIEALRKLFNIIRENEALTLSNIF